MQHSRIAAKGSRDLYASRTATSLTELLVVMTVASAIIGLSGTLIHRLLAAEHDATRAARFAASVARLSRAFRADLHAARSVEVPAPVESQPAVLIASLASGHEVRYEFDAHLATRIETQDGQQTHRDDFHFPPRSHLRCARSADGRQVQVEIEIPARGPELQPEHPSRKLLIEAALARDHRFESPRSQEAPSP